MHDLLVFIPLTVLIVSALLTKKMAESMICATLVAMLMLHKGNFLSGTIDSFYATLSNSSFQFVVLILVTFGGVIQLLQKSGALTGFGNLLARFATTPKRSLLLAWLMAFILFVDEFLNCLTVTFSLRDITDRNGIPREHLALQAHFMACSLVLIFPFSSWTAFTVSLIAENGLGFADYVKAIPFMFYPLLAVILSLLLALGIVPKVGQLKNAYRRVAEGGGVLVPETLGESLVDIAEPDAENASPAIFALIPIAVLVAGVIYFDNDLVYGLFVTLFVQFVMYVGGRRMSVGEFFTNFFDGFKSMTTLLLVIFFGFTLSRANEALGFFDVLIGGVGGAVAPELLPVMTFLLVGFCTFSVGGCWIVMMIAFPIFLSLAAAVGASSVLVIAAVISGISLGYCLCFYADAVFMASAGTGISNLRVIKTVFPYAMVITVLSVIGYLAAGYLL